MKFLLLVIGAFVALIVASWLAILVTGFIVGMVFKLVMVVAIVALASALAQKVVGHRGDVTFTFVSGLLGAGVGILLQRIFGLPALLAPAGIPLLWAFVGSVIVVFGAKLTGAGRGSSLSRRPF